jgi:hypothetical protein
MAGSSVHFSAYNNILLKKNFPTPWAVINLWTAPTRITVFQPNKVKLVGPWNHREFAPHLDSWNSNELNRDTQVYFHCESTRLLWNDTRYYHASMFPYMSELLSVDNIRSTDHARDLTHPGRETAKRIAQMISEKI